MSRTPLLSVVVPAYNAARYLGAAIESVFSQTFTDWELILVDDGSTDDTASVAKQYGSRVRYQYQPNQRQAAARNTGIGLARGQWIAFLDADDLWHPEKLERQLTRLRREDELGFVGCAYQAIGEHGRALYVVPSRLEGSSVRDILLGRAGPGGGSAAVIPRRVLEDLGGFDTELPPCEDTDLLWRIALSHRVGACPEVLMNYRLHEENAHKNLHRMERAWRRLYRKALRDPAIRSFGQVFAAKCHARLQYMLAGEYLKAGQLSGALFAGVTGMLIWPPLGWPLAKGAVSRLWASALMGVQRGSYPSNDDPVLSDGLMSCPHNSERLA